MIKLKYCLRGPNAISLTTWKIVYGSIPSSFNLCLHPWFPYYGHTAGFLITVLLKESNLLFKQGLYCWENTNIVTMIVLMIHKNSPSDYYSTVAHNIQLTSPKISWRLVYFWICLIQMCNLLVNCNGTYTVCSVDSSGYTCTHCSCATTN